MGANLVDLPSLDGSASPASGHGGVRAERLVVVGSGPAGYAASLYAARAELEPLLVEGREAGGQLMLTTEVENYPGFPDGVLGPKLMADMRAQAERFGTRILTADVDEIALGDGPPFTLRAGGNEIRAQAVVVATGAKARWLGLNNEQRLIGRGVSSCATCDGFFFRGKEVVVVGGGDSAMEEATFLTKFASRVTVVHRRDELRASKIMQDRAFGNDQIDFVWNATVVDVLGDDAVAGVALEDTQTGRRWERRADGLFLAIGHDPATSLVAGQLDLDDEGYVLVWEPTTHTSVDGVFAAGDVVDKTYRQAVTAAGMGAKAAIDAERWLAARGL